MKAENSPPGGPQQQIILALDAVDIREEARHQSGGDQQRHGDKTVMHQELIRFSIRIADGTPLATRHKRPSSSVVHQPPTVRTGGQPCGDARRSRLYTKQSTCDYGLWNF